MAGNLDHIPKIVNRCHVEGCTVKSLKYGISGELIPRSCGRHKTTDMVKLELKCHHLGCKVKTFNYNYPNECYGISCNKHKVDGMINVMSLTSSKPSTSSSSKPSTSSINIETGVSFYPKDQPSDWLKSRVFLSSLSELGLDHEKIEAYKTEIHNSEFVYGHVGGSGTSSPQRGVIVLGNQAGDIKIDKTYWTSSQNSSNVTLESSTVPYPKDIKSLVDPLISYMQQTFPDAPVSPSTYALAVANRYDVDCKHTICGHTDSQPWYASPPVFASVTTFPEGQPHDYRATYRFQVKDEGYEPAKYIDLFLGNESVCMMRADIMHRVLPPLQRVKNHVPRVNITFRNLVSAKNDPLGFVLAMSNHYRYYGRPIRMICPSDVVVNEDLAKRYQTLNPLFEVVDSGQSSQERILAKKKLRDQLKVEYDSKNLELNMTMMSKSNVVKEALEMAVTLAK